MFGINFDIWACLFVETMNPKRHKLPILDDIWKFVLGILINIHLGVMLCLLPIKLESF